MKKTAKILLSMILFLAIFLGTTLNEANVCYAKTNTVKVNASLEKAKTIKLNATYTVKGFKAQTECYVYFTLKEATKIKIKVSNVTTGYLHARIDSDEVIVMGYTGRIYHEDGETSATIDGTKEAFPAGKYYIVFNTKEAYSGEAAPKTCKLKITTVE